MFRVWVFAAALAILLGLASGCISVKYHGESFPPTEHLEVFHLGKQPPCPMQIIGRGTASGEYSGTSNADLLQKLRALGLQHGAKAMIIVGTRIVPDGKIADAAQSNFITATDDPDQQETEMEFDEILDSNEFEGKTVFRRIMYAEYLR